MDWQHIYTKIEGITSISGANWQHFVDLERQLLVQMFILSPGLVNCGMAIKISWWKFSTMKFVIENRDDTFMLPNLMIQ